MSGPQTRVSSAGAVIVPACFPVCCHPPQVDLRRGTRNMAKLKKDPITAQDLTDFVDSDSDFGFEMRVLKHLRAEGFSCSHSAAYRDPVTGKIRQYDIRAHRDRVDLTLALAVECKNLRTNSPLLLSAVPRTHDESFHDIIYFRSEPIYQHRETVHTPGNSRVYKAGEMVGRKTDQVGRDEHSGDLTSNDEATFEKLNQAVNSCQDLVQHFANKPTPPFRRVIVPVLVVPTGILWQVDYDEHGSIVTAPRQVERASLFFDHAWLAPATFGETLSYRLSHIEIVTFDALPETTRGWLGPEGFLPPA
jgi:hypothetical protein